MVAERGNGPRQKRSRGDRGKESRDVNRNREDEDEIEIQYQKVVEQVTEVPRTSSRDRTLQCTEEQILDVLVPETTKQLVEVPEIVSRDGVQQRTVEQIVDAPVMQTVEELAEVSKVFSQDRIQQRIVEQTIPAISLAETIVVVPVIQMQRTTQRGVNTHAQHVVNAVEVEKPKIIELTVQRKKFIFQEKINQETKPVEIPQVQFLNKADDKFVVVQRQVSTAQTVQKTMEVPLLQLTDEVANIPVVAQRQICVNQEVQKTIGDFQLQYADQVVDVPVVSVVQVSDAVTDACLTCDAKCKVACETCVKDNTFTVTGEITVAGKTNHETIVRGIVPNIGFESLIDDLSSVDNKRLNYQDCEVLFRVNKQSTNIADSVHVDKDDLDNDAHLRHARDETENADFLTGSMATTAAAQHKSSKHQPTKQAMQQRERKEEKGKGEEKRRGEKGRKENGRKSEEKVVRKEDEEGDSKVVKDVTGWTVVTRNKRQKKMVQIFVKVNGSKATPMEVNLTDDKVEDVMRQIQKDEDVYVTMHGKVLRRDEKLKSCEVTDGCTTQVTSRLRGGGKHKDKRNKAGAKQGTEESGKKDQEVGSMSDKCQEMTKDQKDALIQTIERNEGYRRLITTISEAEDWECRIQRFGKQLQEKSEIGEERAKVMEWGMRWAVEARRRRRRRDEEQGQSTGRGSAGLVRGGDERCRTDETSRKGKGKGNGGKGEHDGKAGGGGSKGRQQVENLVMDEDQENMRATTSVENCEEDVRKLLEMVEREEMELEMMQQEEMEHEEQRGRVAPNMGAGGSHPQATSDTRKKKVLRWADCNDEEGKENEEEVEEEKEAGQWEKTEERPPGLEEVESKQEAKKEQEAERKQEQEQEQEGDRERKAEEKKEREKESSAQEAREQERRAQEAREEERRAQEAHEEQKRAQKTLEKRKAQEEQEREAKAQEERKKEVRVQEERERVAREAKAQEEREKEAKAQEEREREVNAHEERREQEREAEAQGEHESDVKAQEGHEGEVKAQEEQGEDANSLHEESHVSNRHMTWWHNAWWVRVNNGPHLQTARDRRRVWRAATRAAQEVRDTGKVAGGEREKREQGKTESNASNTLHVVFHFPTATTSTQQQQPQQQQQQCVPVGVHQRVLQ